MKRSNLSEKELRIIIVKMTQDLRNKWKHGLRRYKKRLTKT